MVFTPDQISEILELIDVYVLNNAIGTVSGAYLTDQERALLDKYGINYTNRIQSVDDAFRYGMLSQTLVGAKNLNYEQIKKRIKSKNFLPLTIDEQAAIDALRLYNYGELKGLGNRLKGSANAIAIEIDNVIRQQYEKVVKTQAIQAKMNREGVKQLTSRLGHATGDWARDFDRMSDYLLHRAHSEGRVHAIKRQEVLGDQAYIIVQNTACNSCRRLYLNGDGSPKVFPLKELIANGTNVGRKQADWKPVIPPAHPWCYCEVSQKYHWEEWNPETQQFEAKRTEAGEKFKEKRERVFGNDASVV